MIISRDRDHLPITMVWVKEGEYPWVSNLSLQVSLVLFSIIELNFFNRPLMVTIRDWEINNSYD